MLNILLHFCHRYQYSSTEYSHLHLLLPIDLYITLVARSSVVHLIPSVLLILPIYYLCYCEYYSPSLLFSIQFYSSIIDFHIIASIISLLLRFSLIHFLLDRILPLQLCPRSLILGFASSNVITSVNGLQWLFRLLIFSYYHPDEINHLIPNC